LRGGRLRGSLGSEICSIVAPTPIIDDEIGGRS
jgi:hypothetical protein